MAHGRKRLGGNGGDALPTRPVSLHSDRHSPLWLRIRSLASKPFEDEMTEHPGSPRVDELLFADFAIGVGMGRPF